MNKIVISMMLIMSISAAYGQEQPAHDSTSTKFNGSLLWGLYTWGNWKEEPEKKLIPEISIKHSAEWFPVDTTQYELRSILGGAVQWTERKKGQPKDKLPDE